MKTTVKKGKETLLTSVLHTTWEQTECIRDSIVFVPVNFCLL
jgi:hypothetical protein